MQEREGVTKYDLRFSPAPALAAEQLARLNAWRTRLHRLGVIGQDPQRYEGVGFGNMSMRLRPGEPRFVVTGTQTGAIAELEPQHYAVVLACDPLVNRLTAEGPLPPSSESLTHGQVYALDARINFVFHVHAPALWRAAARLQLPTTAAHAAYGTVDMVHEVERLFRDSDVRTRRVFVMGGHEDGVISIGADAEEAGTALLREMAHASA